MARKRTRVRAYDRKTGHVKAHDRGYEEGKSVGRMLEKTRHDFMAKQREKFKTVDYWEVDQGEMLVRLYDKDDKEVDQLHIDSLFDGWVRDMQDLGQSLDFYNWELESSGDIGLYDADGNQVDTVYMDSLVESWLADMIEEGK